MLHSFRFKNIVTTFGVILLIVSNQTYISMNEILERTWLGNTVQDYLVSFGIIIASIILIRFLGGIIIRRLASLAEKTETKLDNLIVSTMERFGLVALYFLAIYWGISYLTLSAGAQRVLEVAAASVIAFFIIRLVTTTVQYLLEGYVRRQENGEEKVKQLAGVILIINFVIWGFGLLFLFDNLGYDITAIIAGLGVGGIAIALAAQNILGDLFNYFVIFFDRPFEVGDFIIVDSKMGVVEYIGLKTTRLKSLTGEQLVFANSDLTNSRIHNYKRMQRRRIVFKLGVIYQTPAEQLKEIPQLIRAAVEKEGELVTFDRAHFAAYGDFSLNFEVVYFVESSDYNTYMDVQQRINFTIFETFERKGIEFAYPTQTLFLAGQGTSSESSEKQL